MNTINKYSFCHLNEMNDDKLDQFINRLDNLYFSNNKRFIDIMTFFSQKDYFRSRFVNIFFKKTLLDKSQVKNIIVDNLKLFETIIKNYPDYFCENNDEIYDEFIDCCNLLLSYCIDDFLYSDNDKLKNNPLNLLIIFIFENIIGKNTKLLNYYIFSSDSIYSNQIAKIYKNLGKLKLIKAVPKFFDYELRING